MPPLLLLLPMLLLLVESFCRCVCVVVCVGKWQRARWKATWASCCRTHKGKESDNVA